jgi:alpha-tubulin suppressor-like RCC1 family protein
MSGMIWTWGNNDYGQLGDNTLTSTSSPVSVCRFDSYRAFSCANQTVTAIDSNGALWSWGSNGRSGSLGNGTADYDTDQSSPVAVVKPGSFSAVARGGSHGLAIDGATGQVWVWGLNSSGQLGTNDGGLGGYEGVKPSPVALSRPGSYSAVAASDRTSLFIDAATGMVWGCGSLIGNNTVDTAVISPVEIARPGSYAAIAIGGNDTGFTNALLIDAADGNIWGWTHGLGQSSPVSIARPGSYVKIAAGFSHCMAIDANGIVWVWGSNSFGKLGLGLGTEEYSVTLSSPVSIPSLGSCIAIAAKADNSYAIDATGRLWAWGQGNLGRLGNNSGIARDFPVPVLSDVDFSSISVLQYAGGSGIKGTTTLVPGAAFVADQARKSAIPFEVTFTDLSSSATSWDWDFGDGTTHSTDQNPTHTYTVAGTYTVTLVATNATGSGTSIRTGYIEALTPPARFSDLGYAWAAGSNDVGQLGNGSQGVNKFSPVSVVGSHLIRHVSLGDNFSLAIDSDGIAWGWGKNDIYQLGNQGSSNNVSVPTTISRSASYTAIAAGTTHALAIDATTGMIWSWGSGGQGELGDNSTRYSASSPISIARPGFYLAASAGNMHSHAIDLAGMVWSWGYNDSGSIGDDTTTNKSSPVPIARPGSYSAISSAAGYTLAIDGATGMVWSWGNNYSGTLGDNTKTTQSSPVSIARPGSYIAISAASSHALAIDSIGIVWAWGSNSKGQLGDNTTTSTSSPISIARVGSYTSVFAGADFSLAIDHRGVAYSWGSNALYGQLGINAPDIASVSSPTLVVGVYPTNKIFADTNHSIFLQDSGLYQPTIVTQPQSQTKDAGDPVTFTVVASDPGAMTYQWRKNGVPIDGAVSDTYTIDPVGAGDDATYSVVVSNSDDYVISAPAILTVILPVTIDVQPSNQQVEIDGTLDLSVSASGGTGTLHYQWKQDGTNVGTDSSSYSKSSFAETDRGSYTVVVSDDSTNVNSNPAVVTVLPRIDVQPLTQEVFLGGILTLSVTAVGYAPISYQWYQNSGILTGEESSTLVVDPVISETAGDYYVEVTCDGNVVTSDTATITTQLPPMSANFTASVFSGAAPLSVIFTDTTTNSPTSWDWDFGDGTASSTDQNPTHAYETPGIYSVTLSAYSDTQSGVKTKYNLIRVYDNIVITVQPISQKKRLGQSVTLSVTATGPRALQYQWKKNNVNISGATSTTYVISSVELSDIGAYSVAVSMPE